MPLYEYACSECGKRTERIEKFDGPHLKKCPHCGGRVERLVSAAAIQFKGSGWYVTDYARSGSSSAENKPSETAGGDKDKSESKSDSKPAEKGAAAQAKEKKKAKEK